MKKYYLFFIIFLLLAKNPVWGQSDSTAHQWGLRECIDYAWKNNLTIQRSEYNVTSAQIDLHQNQYGRLPSVNASGSYGSSWGRGLDPVSNDFVTQKINSSGVGMNASLPLFNGMRIHNTIQQNKTALEASEYDLQKSRNDIALSVANLFITAVFNSELVENARLQLESSRQQLERTRKQVEAGALPKGEQLNLEAQVATNEVNLIQQENALSLSILQLKQALQIEDTVPFAIEVPNLEPQDLILDVGRTDIYNIASQAMPEVKSAKLRVESSYYAVKAAKGNMYPRLSLSGTLNTNYSSVAEARFFPDGTYEYSEFPIGYVNQDSNSPVYVRELNGTVRNTYGLSDQFKDNIYRTVSLQLTIPIFNGMSSRSAVRRSVVQREVSKITEKETLNTLRQNVERAYNEALAASKSYDANLRQEQARGEAYRMMQQRYDNGAANYTEYQLSENEYFRAKSDLTRAKYNFIFTKKILDFYQNKPIDF